MAARDYLYSANLRENVSSRMTQMARVSSRSSRVVLSSFSRFRQGSKQNVMAINQQRMATKKLDVATRDLPNSIQIPVSAPGAAATTRRMESLDRAVLRIARNAAIFAGLTFGISGIAGATVGQEVGFEKSLSNVQALTASTSQEMGVLRAAAMRAGETTVHTARSSSDAMGFLAMAGQTNNQILRSLPATLDLASAGHIDLARAADIATNIQSQFGKTAAQTSEIADKLAYTRANANTDIYEAAEAMNYFGPTAKAMRVSLSESLATISIFADSGLKGSLATRAFGTSLVRLTKPTREAKDVIDKYNLSFFNTEGRFIGIAPMVAMLNKRLGGLNDQQKQSALSTIFQSEAIQELNILLSAGSREVERFTKNLDQSEGTARYMAQVKLDNLAGDFTKLRSASESYAISLGSELDPTLRRITRMATFFVRGLDTSAAGQNLRWTTIQAWNLARGIQRNWWLIKGFVKAYIVLKVATASYNLVLRLQQSLLVQSARGFWSHRASMAASTAATRGATIAQQGFNTALRMNPIGAAVSLVASLAASWLLLRDNIKKANDQQAQFDLQAQEQEFLNQEFKDQRVRASKFVNLADNQRLMDQLSTSEIQRRIQEGQGMLTFFRDQAIQAANYEREAGRSGLLDTQYRRGIAQEDLASAQDRLATLQLEINGSPDVDPQIGLRAVELQNNIKTIEARIGRLVAKENDIRAANPVLINDPTSTSKGFNVIAEQLKKSLDGLERRLPSSDEKPLSLVASSDTSADQELTSQVKSAMSGSAVGGEQRTIVNFSIEAINNIVNTADGSTGAEEVIQQMMQELLSAFNEAGFQVKLASR